MNIQELQYRIYGDDRLSGKLDRVSAAGRRTDVALGNTSNKFKSLKNNIGGAAAEIPGLNRGLALMTNPITMAIGLVGGLGMMLNKAKNEAALFNNEFRELINLNLDKSPLQRNELKRNVLNTAGSEYFDPLKTSTGFYDVQSITGKYGSEVKKIVSQAGTFAQVMRSDFNKTIAGSAQAMEIYGFNIDRVDDYLASLYKTVMVGKTTFDQLTTVQVEYANAAASVGQSFDQANKIFSAFSKVTKTVNIAATMTKTAFEDLTKKSTLDGLQKIGVKIFDAKGQMRGVDEILEDLIPKLKTMTDLDYAKLKENVGGSEGLRGLLDMARNSADKLLGSFELFDKTKFSMNDALKEAQKDINYINDQINNELKVSWINLGESVLPIFISLKKEVLIMVDKMSALIKGSDQINQEISQQSADNIKSKYEGMLGRAHLMSESEFNANQDSLISLYQNAEAIRKSFGTDMESIMEYKNKHGGSINNARNQLKYDRERWTKIAGTYMELIKLFPEYRSNSANNPFLSPGDDGDGTGGTTDGGVKKGLQDISGGGTQLRSVNVAIEALVKELNINTTTLSESAPEAEQKITEMLVRSVAGAEQIISN